MKYELKNEIVILDNRNIQCGIQIDHSKSSNKFMILSYNKHKGFYISIGSFILNESNYSEFYEELEGMRLAMIEANNLIK